ncbi:hypothetical protein HHK36_011115 [Tetracentron sinense]|uniref:Uncharacterized protein n=1 Tax=Tetracentron sinense TaxID=13715 RepID=A0A834ZBW1_TETSI|nr:hypothetical protein HHK36_011115 [Tetracentron sinense]
MHPGRPPDSQKIRIQMDGVALPSSQATRVGMAVWTSGGVLFRGFTKPLFRGSARVAEVEVIRFGLMMVEKYGWREVEIESDAKEIIDYLNETEERGTDGEEYLRFIFILLRRRLFNGGLLSPANLGHESFPRFQSLGLVLKDFWCWCSSEVFTWLLADVLACFSMPPEPMPSDRKDFVKEKKHEKSDSIGSVSMWSDSYQGSRELASWGSDELLRPPDAARNQAKPVDSEELGHGKQGGYQMLSKEPGHGGTPLLSSERMLEDESCWPSAEGHGKEAGYKEPGHGFTPSRPSERMLEDEGFRPSAIYADGKYSRNSRENNGYFSQKEWKGQSSGWCNASPVHSHSTDATAGVTTAAPFEETCPRKKPRLGWGEGLAKYEKKKVEGPDERPRESDCTSPAIPPSTACSLSPGLEEKPVIKAASIDYDTSNLSGLPDHGFQNCIEGLSANLEHLELNPITNLSYQLIKLLQSDEVCSGDSSLVRSTTMNKLLLLKSDILTQLEKTECEIDLYENEFKSLKSGSATNCSGPKASNSLQMERKSKPSEELDSATQLLQRPAPLQLVSSSDIHRETQLLCNRTFKEDCDEAKVEDTDCPGTATSKFVEQLSFEKEVPPSDMMKYDEYSGDFVAARSATPDGQCLVPSINEKKTAGVPDFWDGNHLIETSTNEYVSNEGSLCTISKSLLHDLIWASNKDSASRASEVFDKLLPNDRSQYIILGARSSSWRQNMFLIKEKFAMRKCFLRFKEKILILKFRVFQHLWKEDMRLLSLRKCRAKSQKRFELSSRSHIRYQKHRSSIRSRFTSPGNLTLVPITEMVNFTSKLLSDFQIKLYRNALKMPALILDEKEKRLSRFVTSNGLIEDPYAVEKERKLINPWTSKEKEIFLDMLATFGKDFRKIASCLDHKTTADCIEFYYKNQKSEGFEKIKKLELRERGRSFPTNTYMVTSGKKWNREVNVASLDMLSAASMIATHADDSTKNLKNCGGRSLLGRYYKCKILESSSSYDILRNEKETGGAGVLAGICGSLSSDAVSSCITSSFDPREGCQEWKFQKVSSINGRPLTPEVMQNVEDEETCSDETCGELNSVDWTDEEKSIFIQALRCYGKDFAKISQSVRTRTRDQCKIFFSKARKCLVLDVIHHTPGNEGTPVSDTNGGRSDTEDACVVEMGSALCSTLFSCKKDLDLPSSMTNTNIEASDHAGATHQQSDLNRSRENNGMVKLDDEGTEMVETVFPDDCQAELKSVLICDGNNNFVNFSDSKFDVMPELLPADASLSYDLPVPKKIGQAVTSAGESVSVGGEFGLVHLGPNVAVELKAVPGISTELLKTEPEGRQLLVPENGSVDRRDSDNGADFCSRIDSRCYGPDSKKHNVLNLAAGDSSVNPDFSLTTNHQQQISLELHTSIQKHQIPSWQEISHVPASSVFCDSSAIQYENHRQQASSSILDFEVHGSKQHKKPASLEVYHQYPLGHHSLNYVESSQILRGYPMQVLNKKDMNDFESISSEKPALVQSFSNINRNSQSSQHSVQDLNHDNCNGSKPPHYVAELSLLSKSREQSSSDNSRLHSRNNTDSEEHLCRVGDVKLFGKIRSHPLPLQKPNSSMNENNDNENNDTRNYPPKLNSKSLKLARNYGMDGNSFPSKHGPTNNSGENFPTSNAFWDANKLPDSANLLANYPAAFGENLTSLAVVKRNVQNFGGVSVFPTKEFYGTGGLADYPVYDGTKVQPFTVDVKQHGIFSKLLQKQIGFETVSGFQQQGRVMVGKNVVGRGIPIGEVCTGVSGPVAATKMHHATTRSLKEEESWRRTGA